MTLDPANLYLPPNSSTPVNLNIQNVGNAAGSFDLSAHALPISATINGLPASQSLAQGASASLPLTLTIGEAKPGATFPLVIAGKAINSTTQYAIGECARGRAVQRRRISGRRSTGLLPVERTAALGYADDAGRGDGES